ncbi:MAG: TonB-dependent receptor domain-containing protein [Acidobacteriota bacterium]
MVQEHRVSFARRWCVTAVLLAAVILAASSNTVKAQVLYGSITGNVKDQTGAAVPGAEVTITQTETGRVRTAVTDDSGRYDFPTVQTGLWNLKVSMSGFRDFEEKGVQVNLNSVSRVDVSLQVGGVSETLTVTSASTLLQTDRAEVRAELPSKELEDLPVPIGRNYQTLFGTLPGFSTPVNAHSVPTNPSRALQFNVNGTSSSSNDIRIDGASQFDIWLPHITVYIPSLEAIETVNVVTNSFDAEQGLAGGAAINVQIKSGTNDYHGSGFWYNANNALMAKPFFLPQGERKPKYISNQYGGTVGGPIVRDKLFFFASYEATPERSFTADLRKIPTMAMRNGDFSASDRPIYDPLTGNPDGSGRTAFPGNIIPAGRIDPIARKIFDLMPAPTFDTVLTDNYYVGGTYEFDRSVMDSKVDWHVTDKLSMYGRFSILRFEMLAPTVFGETLIGPALAGGNSKSSNGGTYGTTIAATYVFNPALVVDGNFGYTRKDTASEQARLDEKVGLDFLGIPGTNGTRRFEGGWPRFQIDGFDDIGIPNNFMPYYRRDPQFQWAGNGNWTRGQHNLRFGGELAKQHMNQTQPEFPGANFPAQGGFRFRGGVTSIRGGPSSNDYNAVAAFVLGMPQQLGRILQVPEEYTTRMNFYSLYVRDQWQVLPDLTFSIGTRWEYFPMPTRADRGVERYHFPTNKMLVCGAGVIRTDCNVELSKGLFAPRVGLAYRIRQDFVIRAGYGITNDPFSLARPHRTNYPMLLPLNVDGPNSFTPAGSLAAGVPELVAPDLSRGILDVPPRIAVNSVGETLDRGYIQSWNLTVQKRLPGDLVGEVGYIATRSIRQLGYRDLNAGQVIGAGSAGQPYFATFGRTARTAMFTPIGHSRYDAMQVRVERRFTNGFAVNGNYTWSKTMGIAGLNASDNEPRIKAFAYYNLNWSLADIHIPHRFNLATIYELPFGPGKQLLSEGWAGKILGGWQLNGVMYAQSGTPFTVTASGTSLNLPGSQQVADRVKPEVTKLKGVGRGASWFDPFAFAPITEARFGNSGFNSLLGPKQFNLDVGLFRNFKITEQVNLQFRAEGFNFTNTPHLGNPGANVSSMTLNQDGTIRALNGYTEITSTRNTGREGIDQRVFRFGLRVAF